MTIRTRYEYDLLTPSMTAWRRASFTWHPARLGIDSPPTDEAVAREMLIVMAQQFRPNTRLRLVRVTEETFDAPEQEAVSGNG